MTTQDIPVIGKGTHRLLVVRFWHGEWSHGGTPKDYAEYKGAELYWVWHDSIYSPQKAVKKAQSWRSRNKSN